MNDILPVLRDHYAAGMLYPDTVNYRAPVSLAVLRRAIKEIERLRDRAEQAEERLRDVVKDARLVIERGVELMTNEQVGQWEGVRTWLEMEAPEVSDE